MTQQLTRYLPLVAVTLCASLAQAAETAPRVTVSGFGTLGVTHSDNRTTDFTSTANFQPTGAGYSHSWSADLDSKVGIQLNGVLNEKVSGVLQVVSQYNYNGSYMPHVEWANVSFQATPDLKVRVGRILWPMLLRSETQNIGYGNPFVRNAAELVANMPNTANDGIDVTYQYDVMGTSNSTTFLAGRSFRDSKGASPDFGQNYLHVSGIRGISHVLEHDDLKVHGAYMTMKYTTVLDGPELSNVDYSSVVLGFNYDPGKWFVTADFLKAFDHEFGRATAMTAGAGLHLGKWSPYVTWSVMRQDTIGQFVVDAPFPEMAGAKGDKQTVSAIGVRWDFYRNMDLKLQYEQVKSGPVAFLFPASLNNMSASGDNGEAFLAKPKINAISLVFDFVF